MKTYVIERDMPRIGAMSAEDLSAAAKTSNAALAQLAPRVQWQHSWVSRDKVFCIYLAEDEEVIREHAALTGLPVTAIAQATSRMDPTWG